MVNQETRNQYIPTIGIECHVQLKTNTKLFAAVGNDARDSAPNTLVSHICLGMPGALPVLNEQVVDYAARFAFALGVSPQKQSLFERKHYFYPDLPKGYQITQLAKPIIVGGTVSIVANGEHKQVRINRVQIEEDAGKSTHPDGADYSLVDLNRAGTPLLEIVSEPDMHTAEEGKAYARELWLLVRFSDISDADLYQGNMRFDVNVSVSKDASVFGTRTETKNLNSFRSVEKAIEYEIERQISQLEKGEAIVQETRGWDDAKQKTFSQRTKEDAHDYRYFPDPDIPPVELSDEYISKVQATVPVLPAAWRTKLHERGLDEAQIEALLEEEASPGAVVSYLALFGRAEDDQALSRAIANWCINIEIPLRREKVLPVLSPDQHFHLMASVFALLQDKKLSSTKAKELLTVCISEGISPEHMEKYATEQGFIQESDVAAIEKIVAGVISENPKAAEDVRNGEMKAIGFLVGQVMKASQGKANPQLAQDLIRKQLG